MFLNLQKIAWVFILGLLVSSGAHSLERGMVIKIDSLSEMDRLTVEGFLGSYLKEHHIVRRDQCELKVANHVKSHYGAGQTRTSVELQLSHDQVPYFNFEETLPETSGHTEVGVTGGESQTILTLADFQNQMRRMAETYKKSTTEKIWGFVLYRGHGFGSDEEMRQVIRDEFPNFKEKDILSIDRSLDSVNVFAHYYCKHFKKLGIHEFLGESVSNPPDLNQCRSFAERHINVAIENGGYSGPMTMKLSEKEPTLNGSYEFDVAKVECAQGSAHQSATGPVPFRRRPPLFLRSLSHRPPARLGCYY